MEIQSRIENGWFSERCQMWKGISLSLEVQEVLYSQKSRFQQIDVIETTCHGRILVLDGIIQLTTFDEFAYQEMLTHVPLYAHPNPEKILVIGGGDGGVLREAGRHKSVQSIDFCEIDETVIEISREFFPTLACGFDDSRVSIHIADGSAFVKEHPGEYDVIIVDSSDPVGPGEILFQQPFYESLKEALKPGGIIATQGESFFLHKDCVAEMAKMTRSLFKQHAYSYFIVPTYPGGHIGICLGSMGPDLKKIARPVSEKIQNQLKYYTPEIHEASFVLPHFVEKIFKNI